MTAIGRSWKGASRTDRPKGRVSSAFFSLEIIYKITIINLNYLHYHHKNSYQGPPYQRDDDKMTFYEIIIAILAALLVPLIGVADLCEDFPDNIIMNRVAVGDIIERGIKSQHIAMINFRSFIKGKRLEWYIETCNAYYDQYAQTCNILGKGSNPNIMPSA